MNHDVRLAFGRAAPRYDEVADYQREVGKRLRAGVPWSGLAGHAVDLGCGTGHGTTLLGHAYPSLLITAVDFALPMVQRMECHLPIPPARLCADLHALPLADASVDFVWSSLALQWCDPERALLEIARVLKPGGRVAFSTLGPETFSELRQAFSSVDGYRHTLDFHDEPVWHAALAEADLKTVRWKRTTMTQFEPELKPLLAGVRDLGANRITGGNRRTGLMGKQAWRRLVEAYEAHRTSNGLPLSYDTFFIYAEK